METLVPVRFMPFLAPVIAATLASGQLALAQFCRLVDLGGDFTAGAERSQDVGVTLLIWFCALSAAVATLVAWRGPTRIRFLSAVLAAAGTVAVLPIARVFADAYTDGEVTGTVIRGAVLGLLAALLTAAVPSAGMGVTLHAVLVWAVALVASAVAVMTPGSVGRTFFAGYVLDGIVLGWGLVPFSGRSFGYFPENSMVMVGVLLLFAVVAPAIAVHRTRIWWKGLVVGSTGPILALTAYAADLTRLTMWNEDVVPLLGALAAVGLVLTGITVAAMARRRT